MSNDAQLTVTGNLADDPEPRYTPNGQPAVRFRIASTPRFYDKARESAGCPARARSRSPRRADLAAPNITQVHRPRSPTPCHDQFWAAKITRAGSGGHSHGSALNALPPGQVVRSDACQAAAPINRFGPAEITKERADATRHIEGGSARVLPNSVHHSS
jgi:single-stranded DNA-binding protein